MDISAFTALAASFIAAPPDELYDFIADMPAMGAISPQCIGGEWESDQRGVGAFFIGSNAMGERTWQARMRVSVADRPREFAWENLGSVDWDSPTPLVRWGYTFDAVDGGTRVEETWRILQSYSALEAFDQAAQDGLILWMGRQHQADPVQLAGPLRGLIDRVTSPGDRGARRAGSSPGVGPRGRTPTRSRQPRSPRPGWRAP